jgi:sulfite exporter TauE/SafE
MLGHLHAAFSPVGFASAWCGPSAMGLAAMLFLTGLVGGLAHCGPMCGPFVLAQAATLPADGPIVRRLTGGLLLPYHLGRILTYAGLGAVAGAFGHAIVLLTPVRVAVAALLLAAAALFALQAAARITAHPRGRAAAAFGGRSRPIVLGLATRLARLAAPLFDAPSATRRLALGLVLGLLPCGFLYGALAGAAATQGPAAGAAAMAAFGLGTAPSLMLVGLGGAGLATRWRELARRAVAPLFLFNAAILGAMALSVATAP